MIRLRKIFLLEGLGSLLISFRRQCEVLFQLGIE